MNRGGGDQPTRIDVWLKGVAEIESSALGGSGESVYESASVCVERRVAIL